jgi:dihydrofolate reductase
MAALIATANISVDRYLNDDTGSIERTFDPAPVRTMKDESDRDLSIGGPTLAAHTFQAGLLDEIRLFVHPMSIGGGTPFLPAGLRVNLELREEHRFADGVVFLRYRVS